MIVQLSAVVHKCFSNPKARASEMNVRGALIGKYFLGIHGDGWRSGIVESAIDDDHYLVPFNDVVRMNDGSTWPESLGVVAISEMAGAGPNRDDDVPPPWPDISLSSTTGMRS